MITILGPRDRKHPNFSLAINTTSTSKTWSKQLSPFFLGPIQLVDGRIAKNVENAWQYSKAYSALDHLTDDKPNDVWKRWSSNGFSSVRAERYPAGKGAVPEFSVHGTELLGYIEARIKMYAPMYAEAVKHTTAFKQIQEQYTRTGELTLFDFDGYDHASLKYDYLDVVLDSRRKMGHAFVLAMLLDDVLETTLSQAAERLAQIGTFPRRAKSL